MTDRGDRVPAGLRVGWLPDVQDFPEARKPARRVQVGFAAEATPGELVG